ncbi:hypothetical protein CRG98_033765 [Punica granatum]|uniref:Uncharacterized protein n=1 Tax=Punica granatum TaxID=22663 RepID=A0A2I0IPB2_PUNGR|nr:hypothetical protein CRG98_033765 [Punica granatum]
MHVSSNSPHCLSWFQCPFTSSSRNSSAESGLASTYRSAPSSVYVEDNSDQGATTKHSHMTGESCQISSVDNLQSSSFLYASTCPTTFFGLSCACPSMQQTVSLGVMGAHLSLPVLNPQHMSLSVLARRQPGQKYLTRRQPEYRTSRIRTTKLSRLTPGISTMRADPPSTKDHRRQLRQIENVPAHSPRGFQHDHTAYRRMGPTHPPLWPPTSHRGNTHSPSNALLHLFAFIKGLPARANSSRGARTVPKTPDWEGPDKEVPPMKPKTEASERAAYLQRNRLNRQTSMPIGFESTPLQRSTDARVTSTIGDDDCTRRPPHVTYSLGQFCIFFF